MMQEIAARILEDPAAATSVALLAEEAGYSTDHFSRLFKQTVGHTVVGFINKARLARARHLLRHTSLPVGTIATAVGYTRCAYFARRYRSQYGHTPSDERR
jgi:transcriptional regulator GlxA family with amidase domain